MAFRLPRGNKLTLGHNGQIKPITTRFAGDGGDMPLKQVEEEEVPWSGGEVVESGDPNTLRIQRSKPGFVVLNIITKVPRNFKQLLKHVKMILIVKNLNLRVTFIIQMKPLLQTLYQEILKLNIEILQDQQKILALMF